MAALSRRLFAPGDGLWALPARIVTTLLLWQERARQRSMLANMDDHLLRDLGLDRTAARAEWQKPFWRV